MTTVAETVAAIVGASTWDQRVAEIRLIPQRHGKDDHPGLYAQVARELYVPHLAPDFAYIHDAPFYDAEHFESVYNAAHEATFGFTKVDIDWLSTVLEADPSSLLVFRTITGLLKNELAGTTKLVAEQLGDEFKPVSGSTIDNAEKKGSRLTAAQAHVLATTIDQLMSKQLFSDPPEGLHSKQDKFDTTNGWDTVRDLSKNGVPYRAFLHQRHYGGPFLLVSNATSTNRGDLLEDEVEELFKAKGIPYVRTGSHSQGDIAAKFGVTVTPAPDFVVFDANNTLRAMLECKGTNDGGTARDKANRFDSLHDEGARLGGVPVFAVLGGLGWARARDALGPVVKHTDGRVFTLETLDEMLTVTPFPQLLGLVSDD
ncbi:Uncharacterised protein [Mycobacteroides abscessus subsp. abscessus]|uniref:hypothetical protein n=1 Tax=Mycobacteroides abscessus TaxID=36809 RepID=UPI00092936F9|nr:hypothetical protein [Mycobacteroides abscessus]SHT46354.1 Uncharacterised protein [Mycobacteroides abscessus subsp. abscessus]SHW32665.1 Uncharacterised protein [Mycobacteroides abscessus subsp. abscessus]SIF91993.1 Uncharacterised protein [Mycobacteroides abscessus subsp. abscessus]SKD17766.1 Uncharacterised protein [Mycobacteroides abscessus subsp. abscessus]SKM22869.1 Uncharacterised protein [Mycobacteroides abscessus subsp. abscessus]